MHALGQTNPAGGGGNLNDRELAARVKQALLQQTESSGIDVRVECQDGVIQLSGIVDVLADRQQAEAIARDDPGVRSVENGITVAMDGQVTDEHIRKEVNRRLARMGLGAEVDGGRVTLIGRVDNLAEARQAYRIASGTRGVRDVRSQVRLESAAPDDVAVNNAVEEVLREAGLDAVHIDTTVRDNRVTLSGWVDRAEERREAEDAVSEVDGVRAINNELGLRQSAEEV